MYQEAFYYDYSLDYLPEYQGISRIESTHGGHCPHCEHNEGWISPERPEALMCKECYFSSPIKRWHEGPSWRRFFIDFDTPEE